jgi:hypothetical protein
MSTNTNTTPAKTVIDPNFHIPEGLESFVYSDEDNPGPLPESIAADSDVVEVYTDAPADEDSEQGDISHDAPAIPGEVVVINQKIRTSPDGRQVVDLTLEVDDIDGVVGFDIRVTKV